MKKKEMTEEQNIRERGRYRSGEKEIRRRRSRRIRWRRRRR